MQNLKTLNTLLDEDSTILNGVTVPTPFAAPTLISLIKLKLGEVCPVWQNSADFALATSLWFSTHAVQLGHIAKLADVDYNPIYNTDRTTTRTLTRSENREDAHGGTDTDTRTDNLTRTHSGTDTDTRTDNLTDTHSGTDNSTSTRTIAGFDSDGFENADKVTDSTTHGEQIGHTGTETTARQHGETIADTGTQTNATQYGHTITGTSEGEENVTERTYGNIGVTSNQQMIEAEMNLIPRMDYYSMIVDLYEVDNFICVYDEV